MTIQTLADIVIGLFLIGWICYRQLTWRPADVSRLLRMPVILGAIGVVMLATTTGAHRLSAVDLSLLVIEIVLSLGVGVAMGAVAVFRPMSEEAIADYARRRAERGRDRGRGDGLGALLGLAQDAVVHQTRTGWVGLVLWFVLIGVRIGVDAVAMNLGSQLVTSTGVILVMVAANRFARAWLIGRRLARLRHPLEAGTMGR